MAALAASDVAVTISDRWIEGPAKYSRVKLVFGDGALTYPSGGVPLPTYDDLGFKRNVEFINLYDTDCAQGIVWKYDAANHKLRGFIEGLDVDAAGAATLDDYPIDTTAEPLAQASLSVSLNDDATVGVVYLGRLKELGTSHAPDEATVYAVCRGW